MDDDASFPTENYKDLERCFLACRSRRNSRRFHGRICHGGAEIAKYCGATAPTFNMHNSSMAWSRFMFDMPNLTAEEKAEFALPRARQFTRAMQERATYSQPISEGGQNSTSKPNQTQCRAVEGGWKINGFKKSASLAGSCDYYTIARTEVFDGIEPRHEDTMLFVVHKDAPWGLTADGRVGSVGHARHQQPRSDPEGHLRHPR